jgi:hypothetical protein
MTACGFSLPSCYEGKGEQADESGTGTRQAQRWNDAVCAGLAAACRASPAPGAGVISEHAVWQRYGSRMICNPRSACLDHAQQLLPERLDGRLAGAHVQALWGAAGETMPSDIELLEHSVAVYKVRTSEQPPMCPATGAELVGRRRSYLFHECANVEVVAVARIHADCKQ